MRTRHWFAGALLVLPMAAAAPQVHAQDGPPVLPEIVGSSVFLHYHPDLRHRRDGMLAMERGANDMALRHFVRAAEFSDKPSQAFLADMHWHGTGVPRDRALAYAWMDLAAERGYPLFVAYRERYWHALDADERARVQDVGAPLYARYGDAVARPRMEHMLRKGRMDFTGSRVGVVPFGLEVLVPSPTGGWMRIPEDWAYQERFWHADEYFEWQDEIHDRMPQGVVEIGPIAPGDDGGPR
ncbi:SEL1-like repeat protein [Chiayiivirga flava]|uniref:Sel1 repeat family protein n=1 Tax=Chiayiivirga flava TaxID=659595 RepID=A0A7W8D6K1_9GAMM|nr:SEL1-like repeat protein [Chiayiivirga flava]MBB5208843.1 hypothetical protein [Chiayiivirga flava]